MRILTALAAFAAVFLLGGLFLHPTMQTSADNSAVAALTVNDSIVTPAATEEPSFPAALVTLEVALNCESLAPNPVARNGVQRPIGLPDTAIQLALANNGKVMLNDPGGIMCASHPVADIESRATWC